MSQLVSSLPLSWTLWLGRTVGWIWYYLVPIRRQVALVNVARVFGPTMSPAACRRLVREFPGQWLWVHRRWKVQDDPDGWDVGTGKPPSAT